MRRGSLVTEGKWQHRIVAKYNPFVQGHLPFRIFVAMNVPRCWQHLWNGPQLPVGSDSVYFKVGEVEFASFFSRSSKASTNSWVAGSSLDIREAACKRHYYFWQLKSFLQCFSADQRLITSCSKILGFLSQTWGLTQVEIAETSCRHWTFSTFPIFLLPCFVNDWALGKLRRKFCSGYHSSVVRDVLAIADCGRVTEAACRRGLKEKYE